MGKLTWRIGRNNISFQKAINLRKDTQVYEAKINNNLKLIQIV